MTGASREQPRQLCAVLGHELRNPLASAVTNVTVAAEMTDADDARTPFLRQAVQDLERLSRLLTAYLEHGRSAAPRCARQDLGPVVRTVCQRHDAATVGYAEPTVLLPVEVDPDLLGRALDNLIENSLAVGAGRIDVRLVAEGAVAAVYVSDDGPGVDAGLRDCLFEPFVSGRGSTGLGLAVTRDVVTAHGGRVDLVPSRRGACFRIALPLLVERAALGGDGPGAPLAIDYARCTS